MGNDFEDARMAPHSQEAEEALLGSILINPDAYLEVADFLKRDHFFILRNSWVWEALTRLNDRGEVIDNLTVVEELRVQNRLKEIGGSPYITHLISNVADSTHAYTYARLIERAAIRREMLTVADDIAQLARSEDASLEVIMQQAENRLFALLDSRHRTANEDLIPIADVVRRTFDEVEERQNTDAPMGISTGFIDLDKIVGGFQNSDLVIVAARPGVGKTAFLLSLAQNAAKNGLHVGVFTLEMRDIQIAQRLLATQTGISTHLIRQGKLSEMEWQKFVTAASQVANAPIYINDKEGLSLQQIRSMCRRLKRQGKLDLVVIDYIQLLTAKGNNRLEQISQLSRGLKELAKELNIPILAAAQLNRAVEARQDKRPVLSDLRESGSIEQDADMVMFIYRDELYNEATERPNEADIIIAKHRNGPTGTATLFFRKDQTQFANLKKTTIDLGSFGSFGMDRHVQHWSDDHE